MNIVNGKSFLIYALLLAGFISLSAAPQAGAWCFSNFTDLPIQYWAEDVHKATVGIRQTECWPGALEGKGGERWITVHEVSYPGDLSDKYWYVPVRLTMNGEAIISSGREPGQMTVEVKNDDGEQVYYGQLEGPFGTVKTSQ